MVARKASAKKLPKKKSAKEPQVKMVANPGKSKSDKSGGDKEEVVAGDDAGQGDVDWSNHGSTGGATMFREKFQEHPVQEHMRENWRNYSRDHAEWNAQNASERTKVQSLLRSLTDAQRDVVYTSLDPPIDTVKQIWDVLTTEYAGDLMLQNKLDMRAYKDHTRDDHESIADFLSKHDLLRRRAFTAGLASDEAFGFDLLDSCNMSEQQQTNITRDVRMQLRVLNGGKNVDDGAQPTYTMVRDELRLIMRVKDNMKAIAGKSSKVVNSAIVGGVAKTVVKTRTRTKNRTKTKAAVVKRLAVLEAFAAKVGTSGAPVSGAGTGTFVKKPDVICGKCGAKVWGSKNECFKCGQVKTGSEKLASAGGGGKSAGKGKGAGSGKGGGQVCRHWQATGKCSFENNCRFSHAGPVAAATTATPA